MVTTTPTKTTKPSKGGGKGKPASKVKTSKPAHPAGGKATSDNTKRVMTSPVPQSVKGSDGRKHVVGRFRMGLEKR